MTGEAFNSVYLLAHDRLGTRERGFRLMPDKYTTDACPNCEKDVETVLHRYTTCEWVASLWSWLADLLVNLDDGLGKVTALEVLRFQYPKGLRETAVTWLLVNYIAIVNQEVVVKGRKIHLAEMVGMMRYARMRLKLEAVQDVGLIPLM